MLRATSKRALAKFFGTWLTLGMTSFMQLPESRLLSLALTVFAIEGQGPDFRMSSWFDTAAHPRETYHHTPLRLLSGFSRLQGGNRVRLAPLGGGLVRVDIVNMTRNVGHHFDYGVDGHQRKYRMHVARNETAVAGLKASPPWLAGSFAHGAAVRGVRHVSRL